jgi:hypothetical protein
VNVVTVIVGSVVVLVGVLSLIKPGVPIALRNEWARLISRPFLHGRVSGGEVRTDDPLQRLISRIGGIFFILVGIDAVVVGLLADKR